MKKIIVDILKNNGQNSLSFDSICKKLGYKNDPVKKEEVRETLKELLYEKIITCTNSKLNMFMLSPYKEGIFRLNKKGYGFVEILGEEDVYVDAKNVLGAFNGDKVLVKISDEEKARGRIKEIIERKPQIAEVLTEKGIRYYQFNGNRYQVDIPNDIVDGTNVQIVISTEKENSDIIVKNILGHKNDPGMDIKKILYENDFEDRFSNDNIKEDTKEELKNIPDEVKKENLLGRMDLRNEILFTIDGADTKDRDDAVGIKILSNGNYLLSTHIADVSEYVKEGLAIDRDAYKNSTSNYEGDTNLPMLPRKLSDGICSLNQGVDRLALSFFIEINPDGKTVDFSIKESVINSKLQMTYEKVNDMLDKRIVDNEYASYEKDLINLKKLSDILFLNRIKDGCLEFDIADTKVILNDKEEPVNFVKKHQGTGENIIEELMIVTNKEAAMFIQNLGVNTLFRVHEMPELENIQEIVNVLKSYGYKIEVKPSTSPKFIQYILDQIKETDKSEILSSYILRCMAKARYDVINYGHFGIGINEKSKKAYMHTTSPIRRYPDLAFHRIIKDVIHGQFKKRTTDEDLEKLRAIAIYTSKKERDAQEAERQFYKMESAFYFENLIKNNMLEDQYHGMISGLTSNSMFVLLENLIEGRVSYSSMNDFYQLLPEIQTLVGKRNKQVYRLGDKVDVKVVGASKEDRHIDLEIIENKKRKEKYGNSK